MVHFSPWITILFHHLGKDSAYLDPGSGSFILQLIIAGLVGAGFLVRSYWKKIKNFLRGGASETQEADDDESDEA